MLQHSLGSAIPAEVLLAEVLPAPSLNWALFLDVDDTLLDVSGPPNAAIVERGLRAALASLHRSLEGAVALLSGRSLAELDRTFAPLDLPAAGQHGAELRLTPGGDIMRSPRPTHLQTVRDRLEAFACSRHGIFVEDRGRSLIAHCRSAAQWHAALERAVNDAVAGADDLDVIALRRGFGIKPHGFDDGIAVEWLMRTPAFRDRVPIFVGDSKADACGFVAVKAFGGRAIRVGAPSLNRTRATLSTPREFRRWLIESAAVLRQQGDRCRKRRLAALSRC
jgi:trehalose 6-phosphate phosphatase